MQESALGSVFIFRGRSIGLDNYKSKESLSRVVVRLIFIIIHVLMKLQILLRIQDLEQIYQMKEQHFRIIDMVEVYI